LDSTLFVLLNLSRIEDRRRRRRFAPSLTSSATRTTGIQAIKAATSIGYRVAQSRNPISIFNGLIGAFTLATVADNGMIASHAAHKTRRLKGEMPV
jgi:hypothetical protein